MSEQAVESALQGQSQDEGFDQTDNATEQQSNGYPWAEYLNRVPEGVRPLVEPIFKEWDGNVTRRFQEFHQQLEPWAPIVEEYDPEAVQQAIMLAQAVEADPQGVYNALAQSFGFENTAGNDADEGSGDYEEEDPYEARFRKQEEMLGTIAEILLNEREARGEQEEDAELDEYLAEMKQQFGEFDEDYVLTKMANGIDPETAVQQYQSLVETRASSRNQASQNAPRIMGAGGGLPSNQVDPAQLTDKDTKSLVAQMLAAAAQE